MNKVTIDVISTTPLLAGWYNPNLVDPSGLRTTEIKGIWRWWARAIVGGVLYDEGILVGVKEKNIVKKPSRDEVNLISCYVGKILGLGYVGPQGSESSRFTVRTETLSSRPEEKVSQAARKYQRLNLLALSNYDIEYIPENTKFRITIQVRPKNKDGENLALKILILALQLSGVGKGARRGLGSLDVINITAPGSRIPYGLRELVDEVYESALDVVGRYGIECSDKAVRSRSTRTLPPLPVISKSVIEGVNVSSTYVIREDKDLRSLFYDVHNFFVRSERCRKLYNKTVCSDELRLKQQAWILGLPRSQRGTGYEVKTVARSEKMVRRASPFIISCHSKENIFGKGVFVTITMSGDWPSELRWLGRGVSKIITIRETDIISATTTAIKEFEEYIRKSGYTLAKVWP
jgi:CRISPR-associated protein Cmr1